MSGPKYQTVLWDMDGVLIDSERHWKSLENFFLKDVVNDWESFDQSRLVGRSLKDIYTVLNCEHGISITYDEYIHEYNKVAKTIYHDHADLIPNAMTVLSELQQSDFMQALVSSSTHTWINFALERFQIRRFFEAIISADDVNGAGKPDPAIYEYACRQLNVTPEDTIVIEDSLPGIQAANGAGCSVIWFNPSDETQATRNVDFTIYNLSEVLSIVGSSG